MANNADKVLFGLPTANTNGVVSSAPLGTALPTDSRTPLDPAFIGGGYVGDDGVSLALDISTNDFFDMGGTLLRRVLNEFSGSLTWPYSQLDATAAKATFGEANVTVTPATADHGEQLSIAIGAELPEKRSWVFDMRDGDNLIRVVVPIGQITSWDSISFSRSDPINFTPTLSAYPDSAGKSIYFYTDDGEIS